MVLVKTLLGLAFEHIVLDTKTDREPDDIIEWTFQIWSFAKLNLQATEPWLGLKSWKLEGFSCPT